MRLGLLSLLLCCWVAPAWASQDVAVQLAPVVQESVSDPVEALGTLKANESVELSANVSDIVERLHFESGQRVKKGDVLAELVSDEQQALLREAQYTQEEASAQLERIKTLIGRGDASRSLLDERQREFNVARARVQAIESRLRDRRVIAPFDGVVGLRDISPGAFVAAGDVITRLIDDSRMKLDFSVPSVFLPDLVQGMAILAHSRALGEREFRGTVHYIDNRIDPVSRAITVRAIIPNPDRALRPGLLMEVDLLTRQRQALVIPELALVPQGQQQFVFVAHAGEDGQWRAQRRAVTTGSRWQGKVEISAGLKVGEQVVTHGTLKMRDQLPIRVLDDWRTDTPADGAR